LTTFAAFSGFASASRRNRDRYSSLPQLTKHVVRARVMPT
jgi:hypothetical protein